MDESTFVCLTYIYMIMLKEKYNKLELKDFKKHVFSVYKRSCNVTDFRIKFISGSLCMENRLYRLRRNFVKFLTENNCLLGYQK